ncbi:uncharacterized protein ACIBXB_001285 [Morphnus guianensis]
MTAVNSVFTEPWRRKGAGAWSVCGEGGGTEGPGGAPRCSPRRRGAVETPVLPAASSGLVRQHPRAPCALPRCFAASGGGGGGGSVCRAAAAAAAAAIAMAYRGQGQKVQKVMVQPINLIFRYLQNVSTAGLPRLRPRVRGTSRCFLRRALRAMWGAGQHAGWVFPSSGWGFWSRFLLNSSA